MTSISAHSKPHLCCLLSCATLLLTACQPVANVIPKATQENNLARVFVYRPSSNFLGIAVTRTLYVNGAEISTLGAGKSLSTTTPPGDVTIKVETSFLGMTENQVEFKANLAKNQDLYLRYSERIGTAFMTPSGAYAKSAMLLQPVSAQQFESGE